MAQLNRKTQILCFVTETIMTSVARPRRRPPKIPRFCRQSGNPVKWLHLRRSLP